MRLPYEKCYTQKHKMGAATEAKLQLAVDWLNRNQNQSGMRGMGRVYFPLFDDRRRAKTRKMDCTERIAGLIAQLTGLE